MLAAREGQQQVHGQRPIALGACSGNLAVQLLCIKESDRPEAAGLRHRQREPVTREAAAHPRLHDWHLDPHSLQ